MNSKLKIWKITFMLIVSFFYLCSCKDSNNNKISKSKALEIATRYNIVGDSVEIYFDTYIYPPNSSQYKKGIKNLKYWHVSKKCNGCGIIQIDAESGKVFTTGKYNYQY